MKYAYNNQLVTSTTEELLPYPTPFISILQQFLQEIIRII